VPLPEATIVPRGLMTHGAAASGAAVARALSSDGVEALAASAPAAVTARRSLGLLPTSPRSPSGRIPESVENVRSSPDASAHPASTPRVRLDLQCDGSPDVVAQILAMSREALHNVERHARAASATVRARVVGTEITVEIEDDGVGFESDARPPWTIASRVAELGGLLRMRRGTVGAQLSISVPKA